MDIDNINKYIIPLIREQCDSLREKIDENKNNYEREIGAVKSQYENQYKKIIELCKYVFSLAKKCFRDNPSIQGITEHTYKKDYDLDISLKQVLELDTQCNLDEENKTKIQKIKSILVDLNFSKDIHLVIDEVNKRNEGNKVKVKLNEKQNEAETKILTENNEKIVTSKTEFDTEINDLQNLRKKLIAFFKSEENIYNILKSEIKSAIKSNQSVEQLLSNFSILNDINTEIDEIDEIKINPDNPDNPSADDVICPLDSEVSDLINSRLQSLKLLGGARKGKSRKHLRKQSKKTKKRKASSKKTKRKKSKSGTKKRKKTKRKKRK